MSILLLLFITLFAQPLLAAGIQEFSADYEILYGDIHLGKANYRFSETGGDAYRFDFSSDLKFLIFWDERVVSSELVYEDQHLLPGYYSHDRKGTGRDYLEEIFFDPSEQIIRSTYRKESKEYAYEKDIVDGLTMQLQLMLDLQNGIERPNYRIVDFNKVREFEFSLAGEETINIEDTSYNSVVYQVVRNHQRRTTKMWFSPERNYLPLQMVHFSDGKKKFNAHLVHYNEFDSSARSTELSR